VGVAVSLKRAGDPSRDLRFGLAAVAPTPLRARPPPGALRGRRIDDTGLDAAARGAMDEARPIGDVRGSADYRRRMVGVLTRRAIEQAWKEAA
jgi:carbon-monoxide dehydrogenase medium subunit